MQPSRFLAYVSYIVYQYEEIFYTVCIGRNVLSDVTFNLVIDVDSCTELCPFP